jgi:hypothetical protein
MRFLRKRLSWMLTAWLGCQGVALAAPVALAAAGTMPVEELCTCTGGDHETCPMHHSRQADEPGRTAICGMSSACAPADVALLSMAGGAGVLPGEVRLPLLLASTAVSISQSAVLGIVVLHDTPPPRL